MQDNVQENTQKPVLDIFKEMAEKRGLTLAQFAEAFGYTPKVLEAMEQHPWFQPSLVTLDTLHKKYEVSREECQALEHCYVAIHKQLPEDHREELLRLYDLMTDHWRAITLDAVREKAETYYRFQEPFNKDDHRRLGF
jgi:transcriptional regulator with XRE-family HTH domain